MKRHQKAGIAATVLIITIFDKSRFGKNGTFLNFFKFDNAVYQSLFGIN